MGFQSGHVLLRPAAELNAKVWPGTDWRVMATEASKPTFAVA
jgi:hypothetical protein